MATLESRGEHRVHQGQIEKKQEGRILGVTVINRSMGPAISRRILLFLFMGIAHVTLWLLAKRSRQVLISIIVMFADIALSVIIMN